MSRPYFEQAQRVGQQTGLDPNLVWAQWYHESGGFNSQLARENFNFGGVTQEEPNGEENKQPDGGNYYKVFNSPDEYADWYANYIQLYRPDGLYEAQNVQEFASALKRGGYYTADETEYANGMLNALGEAGSDPVAWSYTGPYGVAPRTTPAIEPEPHGFWKEAGERALDITLNGGGMDTLRYAWALLRNSDIPFVGNGGGTLIDKLTQEDVDYVVKAFPGDAETQNFILANARNSQHLNALISMKTADQDRAHRISYYHNGLAKVAGTVAGFAGSILTDPLTYIPAFQSATMLKAFGRLGPTAYRLSTTKLGRYAGHVTAGAATGASGMVADRYLAETFGGEKQDYGSAALLGSIAGSAFGLLGGLFQAGKMRQVANVVDNMETHAIAAATDGPLPSRVPKDTRAFVKTLHNLEGLSIPAGSSMEKALANEKVYVVPRAALPALANRLKRTLRPNMDGFHNRTEGYTILTKERIQENPDTLDDILRHELGVHAGLRKLAGQEAWQTIQRTTEANIANPPSEQWNMAIRMTPGGGWEEVLGYYMEHYGIENSGVLEAAKTATSKGMRKLGSTHNYTDGELKELVQRSFEAELEDIRGYRLLEDGSAVVPDGEGGELLFSAMNLLHPNRLAEFGVATREEVREKVQGDLMSLIPKGLPNFLRNWLGKAGESLEAGSIQGTPYGVLANSVSETSRKIGSLLFHDARDRESKGPLVMPVEKIKQDIMNKLVPTFGEYLKVRDEAIYGKDILEKLVHAPTRVADAWLTEAFDRDVMVCFNAKYAGNTAGLKVQQWSPDVEKGAAALKRYYELYSDIAKRSSEMYGSAAANLLPKDAQPRTNEFHRVTDRDLWLEFRNKFASEEKALEWMTGYGKAMGRLRSDEHAADLLESKVKEWETKSAENTEPKPTSVSPEELQKYIEEQGGKWAFGQLDLNASNLDKAEGTADIGAVPFMQRRFHGDTTLTMETPWGETWSYDTHLRSYDIDHIIHSSINRFAGEAALRNAFETPEQLEQLLKQQRSELEHARNNKLITPAQLQKELKLTEDSLNRIRGVRDPEKPPSVSDAMGNMLLAESYNRSGSMMVTSQIAEINGVIAHTGGRGIAALLNLSDTLRAVTDSKQYAETIRDVEKYMFGEKYEQYIWQDRSNLVSRTFHDAMTKGRLAGVLDAGRSTVNFATRLLNSLPPVSLVKLTEIMISTARKNTLADSVEWAFGKEKFGLSLPGWTPKEGFHLVQTRNPFSEDKLKAAGVTPELAERIRQDIQHYTSHDTKGKVNGLKVEQWERGNPVTYQKLKVMIDNQSHRAVQQITEGNRNLLKDTNMFTRILFQFKDFTFRAVNGQALRALSSRQIEDVFSAILSIATNAAVYSGQTYMKALAYFPNDPDRRQAYLDSRLSLDTVMFAGFLRSPVTGALFSLPMDIWEGVTGRQSFRTTTDRTSRFSGVAGEDKGIVDTVIDSWGRRDRGDIIGDFLTQLPAAKTAIDPLVSIPKAAYKSFSDNQQLTQRDIREALSNSPMANHWAFIYAISQMLDATGLPEK